ncbi:MAG: SusC/RagA family TonB-linked outer membrane protein [Flavobacteriaceae bacterium]|nr:SusC/RagA family TonB-linked outer membrane protein [Flavobacteriaceae bacterium]
MKNNYRQRLVLAITFALFLNYNSSIFSQNLPLKTISGTITDTDGPLSGVNVLVKNTARGSISDLEGRYSLTATATDTLVFTYLGYKTQELSIGIRSVLDVLMQLDATTLDQVVINAGYYKVSDRERTGSITKITAKEIENQPVSNPLAAIQGRIAGVFISPSTGLASGGYTLQIRGQNSIASGNEPLYIIDGIPYDSNNMGFSYVGSATLPLGVLSPLSLIDTDDIESIEILKDADATSIYGSRGANGVVLITTKKGSKEKTTFTINTYTGTGQVAKTLDYMKTDQYLAMRREAFKNDGLTEYPQNAYDLNGTWDQNRYTDWQKELIGGTAYLTHLGATVTGGTKRTHFLLNGGYHNETTVFPKDYNYKRLSLRAGIDHSSNDDKFKVSFATNYAVDNNDLPGMDISNLIRLLPPNAPALYNENGKLNFENGTFNNPLAELEGKYLSKRNNLVVNSQISYELFSNFTLLANLGFTKSDLDESRTIPHTKYDPALGYDSRFSFLYTNTSTRESWIVEPQLRWEQPLGLTNLEILLGATFQEQTDNILSHYASGFPSNSLIYNLAAAYSLTVQRDALSEYKYQAFFGRLNYNLSNKYIFNITGRRDGSSRFGPNRRFAVFGAIGAAWLFGEEEGVKNFMPVLSFGKLRGSYGVTGNDQIGDYEYLETYSTDGTEYLTIRGISPTRINNPDFGWETNRKFNVALELGFLKNRVNLTAEYFQNRSSNQLVGMPLPGTTGFSTLQANLEAIVENTGFEISLNTINIKTEAFRWSTDFNLTIPKNRLVDFPMLKGSPYANQYVIGESLNIKKLYHLIGVDPETGLYQFEDYNADGTISAPEDRQYIADLTPKVFGGLNNMLTIKNWELAFLFQFTQRKNYNKLLGSSAPGRMANQPDFISGQWQNPGDSSNTQLFTAGYNPDAVTAYSQYMFSDASISDASYIRLKNASLAYSIPSNGMRNVKCRVYLQGENLFLLTKFKSGDPEQLGEYLPPLRKITLGLQLTI